ncbi:nuclear transport factor 2 family protein [Streptomyces ipomoeae]|uniref:Nuclear transport factor 2 family protein n=1 Tax=Streptomyces ipomoeae TaxID=103232 RepID=A0AAE8VV64_9ACTN|nr:nuclear transport factor 2 family protein [Streptomyces ipomoeae]MDX2937350.1 nuclear transport factor 2 family protein [Streptomyces ipomoeae]TQE15996.1 nuclear transport factor 2 family protein [Streptomyces ipomoeae]TQE23811.1 nuclear transport factor 2 family protein [Streptomyces ipomoeae]
MAEHPHAQLVRKGYDAFSRGDMDTLRSLMTSDCAHHVPGNHILSGDYKGQDNVIELYRRLFDETGGTFEVTLERVVVDGRGHAVSVHRYTAERGDRRLEQNGALIFRIIGDKISDIDECQEDLEKEQEFWS